MYESIVDKSFSFSIIKTLNIYFDLKYRSKICWNCWKDLCKKRSSSSFLLNYEKDESDVVSKERLGLENLLICVLMWGGTLSDSFVFAIACDRYILDNLDFFVVIQVLVQKSDFFYTNCNTLILSFIKFFSYQ